MIDALFELTALPNLHPALVHFPIALTAAALLFDMGVFLRGQWAWVERSAAALWVLAAAGAGITYVAGRVAADGVGALSPAAEATLASHADAALATVSALTVLALLRVWLTRRDGGEARARREPLRVMALLAALMAQGLVAYTGDLGGALVYRHGVAVSSRPSHALEPTAIGNIQEEPVTSSRFAHLEDGAMVWTPRPDDEAALGEALRPLGEVAVRVASSAAGAEGLSLVASGRTLLALPGSWEDVRLEIRLEALEFEGVLALGARVAGDLTGGFLRIGSDGTTELVVRREGKEEVLDEAKYSLSGDQTTLGVSAVGRHWKGFEDGRTVLHGHSQLPGAGHVALLLDGVGTVRLISVRISPVGTRTGEAPPEVHERDSHEH